MSQLYSLYSHNYIVNYSLLYTSSQLYLFLVNYTQSNVKQNVLKNEALTSSFSLLPPLVFHRRLTLSQQQRPTLQATLYTRVPLFISRLADGRFSPPRGCSVAVRLPSLGGSRINVINCRSIEISGLDRAHHFFRRRNLLERPRAPRVPR